MKSKNHNKQIKYKSSRFEILPNQHTKWHNHYDTEVLVVVSGEGYAKIDGHEKKLNPGDIINLSPLQTHIIFNSHPVAPLVMCNFWWEDNIFFNDSLKNKLRCIKNTKKSEEINFILPSFTTPNGNLHLGHIAGPLLAADVIKRIYKINNANAYLLSGTIGHQTQVQVEADKLGKTFTETALLYSKNIKKSLEALDIDTDCFITLEEKDRLIAMSELFIKRLFEKDHLKLKESNVYHCDSCDKYLFEANIFGNCPHCDHNVNAECENCYEYFHESELKNPVCLTCKKTPTLKKLNRYYFSMNTFRHVIENLYYKNSYTGSSKHFVEKIIKKPLPDIPMTIIAKHGVPFKHNTIRGHVLYSAIELLPRFLTAAENVINTQYGDNNFENVLQSNTVNLTLLFGVDNLYLRCIIFPILLSAYNEKITTQLNFISNDFYKLNNSKFSTSRNHVISVEKIKETADKDSIRYFLAMTRPEFYSTSFNIEELIQFMESGSLKIYRKLSESFKDEMYKKFNDVVPEPGSFDNFHYAYQSFLDSNITLALSFCRINTINFMFYTNLLSTLIDFTSHFFETGIKTPMNESHCRTFYALCAKGIFSISILISPISPTISKEIQSIFYKRDKQHSFDISYLNTWLTQ